MKLPRVTLVQFVTGVVITMWIVTNIADIFVKDYTPPEALNTAFMALVGPLLVFATTKRGGPRDDRQGGDDNGDD